MFQGEYHQAYAKSELITDFGYTKGYKKPIPKDKQVINHIFFKVYKNFSWKENSQNEFDLFFKMFQMINT